MSTALFSGATAGRKPLIRWVAAVCVVGWALSSCQSGDSQADRNTPVAGAQAQSHLTAIFETLAGAQSLAANTAAPTEYSTTDEELERLSSDTAAVGDALAQHLAVLNEGDYPQQTEIRRLVERLTANAETVDSSRAELRGLIAESRARTSLFSHHLSREVESSLVTILDDQFAEMLEKAKGGSELSKDDIVRFHHMHNVLSAVRSATIRTWAVSAFNVPTGLAAVAQEGFSSENQRLRHSLQYLAENGGPNADFEKLERAWLFLAANTEERNVLDSLALRRELLDQQSDAVADNRRVMAELTDLLNTLSQSILAGS